MREEGWGGMEVDGDRVGVNNLVVITSVLLCDLSVVFFAGAPRVDAQEAKL